MWSSTTTSHCCVFYLPQAKNFIEKPTTSTKKEKKRETHFSVLSTYKVFQIILSWKWSLFFPRHFNSFCNKKSFLCNYSTEWYPTVLKRSAHFIKVNNYCVVLKHWKNILSLTSRLSLANFDLKLSLLCVICFTKTPKMHENDTTWKASNL